MYMVYRSTCIAAICNDYKIKVRPPHAGCGGRDGVLDLAVTVYFLSCGLGSGFSGRRGWYMPQNVIGGHSWISALTSF